MEAEVLLQIIEENGYLGLFLMLWLGIFGLPVPNEVLVMSVGLLSSMKSLNLFVAFGTTYGGIVAAQSTSYLLGRFIGWRLLPIFLKRKRLSKTVGSSLKLMDRYHALSLALSYFVPGVRNFVPFLYGFSRLSFKTFAFFAYLGSFLWLSIMFSLGYMFGDKIDHIFNYGIEILLLLGGLLVIAVIGNGFLRRRKQKIREIEQHQQSMN